MGQWIVADFCEGADGNGDISVATSHQIPGSLMQGHSAVREQFVRPFITA
jgi:hypothetical protein